ncbi:hypothetical protein DL766_002689 [Monosporascus sp. MC13-8B]|uniref:Major facilitator superfamily (MFS) profile domain-containing protein n=1 Tax=Monosporascus cannonballus TaxID=155416 RepID=A0ABY0H2S8_9PEZI|nr:hypothetical protein DL762_006185 [Monosporascus cannonballus]RYP35125.1 hypothetical protein DL766_002689 [Monosporascus sp. MC13-8B]
MKGDDHGKTGNLGYPASQQSVTGPVRIASDGEKAQTNEGSPPTPLHASSQERGVGDMTYLHGLRFWAASALLAILFFLVSMEISVVTTALVAITDDLGGFQSVSWVLSSYLLGYVSVVILVAKFSDIFGRKQLLVSCIFIFTALSGGCAAAQSMTQL